MCYADFSVVSLLLFGCSRVIVQSLTAQQVVALWRYPGIPPEHRHLHCNPSCVRIDLCPCRHRQGHEHFVFDLQCFSVSIHARCLLFVYFFKNLLRKDISIIMGSASWTAIFLNLERRSGCVWIKHVSFEEPQTVVLFLISCWGEHVLR